MPAGCGPAPGSAGDHLPAATLVHQSDDCDTETVHTTETSYASDGVSVVGPDHCQFEQSGAGAAPAPAGRRRQQHSPPETPFAGRKSAGSPDKSGRRIPQQTPTAAGKQMQNCPQPVAAGQKSVGSPDRQGHRTAQQPSTAVTGQQRPRPAPSVLTPYFRAPRPPSRQLVNNRHWTFRLSTATDGQGAPLAYRRAFSKGVTRYDDHGTYFYSSCMNSAGHAPALRPGYWPSTFAPIWDRAVVAAWSGSVAPVVEAHTRWTPPTCSAPPPHLAPTESRQSADQLQQRSGESLGPDGSSSATFSDPELSSCSSDPELSASSTCSSVSGDGWRPSTDGRGDMDPGTAPAGRNRATEGGGLASNVESEVGLERKPVNSGSSDGSSQLSAEFADCCYSSTDSGFQPGRRHGTSHVAACHRYSIARGCFSCSSMSVECHSVQRRQQTACLKRRTARKGKLSGRAVRSAVDSDGGLQTSLPSRFTAALRPASPLHFDTSIRRIWTPLPSQLPAVSTRRSTAAWRADGPHQKSPTTTVRPADGPQTESPTSRRRSLAAAWQEDFPELMALCSLNTALPEPCTTPPPSRHQLRRLRHSVCLGCSRAFPEVNYFDIYYHVNRIYGSLNWEIDL